MLIGLTDDPPEILTKSPYKEGLLYFARNEPLEKVRNAFLSCFPSPAVLVGEIRWMWTAFRSSRMDTKSHLEASRHLQY